MKRSMVAAAVFLLGLLNASAAMAGGYHHHGHSNHSHWSGSVGVVIGGPVTWPWYYPSPYYSSPYYSYPLVVEAVPATPPVYIERGSEPETQAPPSYYYCSDPQGYYPYVRTCPRGWQQVPVQPPS